MSLGVFLTAEKNHRQAGSYRPRHRARLVFDGVSSQANSSGTASVRLLVSN
ncbi:hypothetical protein ACG710_001078 [Escherichia coli]